MASSCTQSVRKNSITLGAGQLDEPLRQQPLDGRLRHIPLLRARLLQHPARPALGYAQLAAHQKREYSRYGYRRVMALLRVEGWRVNPKRVKRIWRREGPKVLNKQPKRAPLWLNDGSCIRLRPECKDHVWAYDFLHHRTHEGRALHLLTIVDEYTKECLAIDVERLGELGRRIDLVERSVRRGEGDPELAAALRRDAEGEWE